MPLDPRADPEKIWKLHLEGKCNREIAGICKLDLKVVDYVVDDMRGKYPRKLERRAMRRFVRKLVLSGASKHTIYRQVWDIFRMTITLDQARATLTGKREKRTGAPLSSSGRDRKQNSKSLPARVTAAVCASRVGMLREFVKEARNLAEELPPDSKKMIITRTAQGIVRKVTVPDLDALVADLFKELEEK